MAQSTLLVLESDGKCNQDDVAAAFFLNELLCFLETFFVSCLYVVFIIIPLVFFLHNFVYCSAVHQCKFAPLLFYSFSFSSLENTAFGFCVFFIVSFVCF